MRGKQLRKNTGVKQERGLCITRKKGKVIGKINKTEQGEKRLRLSLGRNRKLKMKTRSRTTRRTGSNRRERPLHREEERKG